MSKEIKISYLVDNFDWFDIEFEEKSEREFIITEEMIKELIYKYGNINTDTEVIQEIL